MSVNIKYTINSYEYLTRQQMPDLYPVSIYDTQRFLETNRSHIEHHKVGKVIYYRKFDLDRFFRIQQLRKMREEVLEKVRQIHR